MLRLLSVLMLIFTMSGCVTSQPTSAPRPSDAQILSADYGPNPTNHEAIIKAYLEDALYDPYSARYSFEPPVRSYNRAITPEQPIYGWVVCGKINAKNRYGAYVGNERFYFLIRDGQVLEFYDGFKADVVCDNLRGPDNLDRSMLEE